MFLRNLGYLAGLAVGLTVAIAGSAEASKWLFMPSNYSHTPDGQSRVAQYRPLPEPVARYDPTYSQSAYRHTESHLRGGRSADRLHIVETWGLGEYLRPYGEWERPFREGATPFGPWGNPQGPWTTPFGSWVNPYGLGRLPYPPWGIVWPWFWYGTPGPVPSPSPNPSSNP